MHPGGRPSHRKRSILGKRLAEARQRAGISQAALAEMMGTTQPAVAYWERDASSLRSDVLVKLTQILEVSADELLGIKPPRPKAGKTVGKARQMFEAVSRLPRRQQEKIFDILQPFVEKQSAEAGS